MCLWLYYDFEMHLIWIDYDCITLLLLECYYVIMIWLWMYSCFTNNLLWIYNDVSNMLLGLCYGFDMNLLLFDYDCIPIIIWF